MAGWMDRVYSELQTGPDAFLEICQALDGLEYDPNAQWQFDGMSGAFKFVDESPGALRDDDRLCFPCIDLLRCLWGYRLSVVRAAHRSELFDFFRAVRIEAPNWPGFHPDRCSPAMLPVADECKRRSAELSEGLDELDRRINEQMRAKREQQGGGK